MTIYVRQPWGKVVGSIHDRLDIHDNALNFLRLILACFVIVSHSAPVGGFGAEWKVGGLTLGNVAVGGFFAVSGYLITASRFGSDLRPYLWRRFLRIFPAYWACLALVGLVFSGFAGIVRAGWSVQAGLGYFWSNVPMIFAGDSLSATLAGAPFSGTWNGSLWTLRYELACYVLVGILLSFPFFRRSSVFFAGSFIFLSLFSFFASAFHVGGVVGDVGFLAPFFAAGALLFRFRSSVTASGRLALAALLALGLILLFGAGRSLAALPVAYLCMWIGIAAPQWFRRVGRRNDLSYGIYLYGFPVQQILVLLGMNDFGLLGYTLLSIIATVPMAAISWFFVEKPAMRLKQLVKGRHKVKRETRLS